MTQMMLPGIAGLLNGLPAPSQDRWSHRSQRSREVTVDYYRPSTVQPRSQGWFDADQEEVRRAACFINSRGFDRTQLYDAIFAIDETRPLYERNQSGPNGQKSHDGTSRGKHQLCEKKRRTRHAEWQKIGAKMTMELAHEASVQDPVYIDAKTNVDKESGKQKNKNGQKFGKDEQFCSIIYTVAFLGIAIQAEHDARLEAEARAAAAERRLACFEGQTRKRGFEEDEVSMSSSSWSPLKRRMVQAMPRLPPSPTLTATLSPSPTPLLSGASSFNH